MPQLQYIVDGEVYKTEEHEAVDTLIPPEAPEKEGYNFVRWADLPPTMPDGDLQIQALYEPDSFTLTEVVDDEVYETRLLQSGTDLTALPLPEKKGYTFSGWMKKYKKMPKSNLTLRGSFKVNRYKLTFEIDGMTFERTVEYGAPLDRIAVPERDHYTFSGWGNIPAVMPDHDLHFSGSFRINTYTLTYLIDGALYRTERMAFGEPVKPASVETKEGYVFSGWRGLPKTMPEQDVTIEGKYYRRKTKVTFLVDGEKFAWLSLTAGEKMTVPEEPHKDGFVFRGWRDLPETVPAYDIETEAEFTAAE